jgi:hypothetical protein
MKVGSIPTVMFFITVFVVKLITDTVSDPSLATYIVSNQTDVRKVGALPTVMFFITIFVVPLITDTVSDTKLATYT